MKIKLQIIVLLCAIFFSTQSCNVCTSAGDKSPKLRHVVLFGFSAESTNEDKVELVSEFQKLPSLISEIKEFENGTDISPEGLQQGLSHAFLLTFESEKDRDAYLVHPDHKTFGSIVKKCKVDKVTVLDYWTSTKK